MERNWQHGAQHFSKIPWKENLERDSRMSQFEHTKNAVHAMLQSKSPNNMLTRDRGSDDEHGDDRDDRRGALRTFGTCFEFESVAI